MSKIWYTKEISHISITTHTSDTTSGPDDEVDVDEAIRAKASVAENHIFLGKLFGIKKIDTISDVVKQVVNSMHNVLKNNHPNKKLFTDSTSLTTVLTQNITEAFNSISQSNPTLLLSNPQEIHKARLVADAIRKSIPQAVLDAHVYEKFNNDSLAKKLRGDSSNVYGAALASAIHINDPAAAKIKLLTKLGTLQGDAAQHAVISEYLQSQGMTESEATAGANYLRTRSLIDTTIASALSDRTEEEFGEDTSWSGKPLRKFENLFKFRGFTNFHSLSKKTDEEVVSEKIIGKVAHACRIPTGKDSSIPDWAHVNDIKKLYTAFYAMKKLLQGGDDVPSNITLQRTKIVQQEMLALATVIIEKKVYANMMQKSKSITPAATVTTPAAVSKDDIKKMIDELMSADIPAEYVAQVDARITHMATDGFWEALRFRLYGDAKKSLMRGKTARNLLYGNDYASIVGLGTLSLVTAPKWIFKKAIYNPEGSSAATFAGKAVWKHKWPIVGGVAGFTFGGPIGAGLGVVATKVYQKIAGSDGKSDSPSSS